MYKLLLILKYLRKRRIAWVSLAAVMLCTAMVLIVISVMGGWLRMFRSTNHDLIGDLIVDRAGLDGFSHYEEMQAEIEKLQEVKATMPEIETIGIMSGWNVRTPLRVVGIDIKKVGQINGFIKSLHLQPDVLLRQAADVGQSSSDARTDRHPTTQGDVEPMKIKAANFPSWDLARADTLAELNGDEIEIKKNHKMIVGAGVLFQPDDNGKYIPPELMYHIAATLNMLAVHGNGSVNADDIKTRNFRIVDDSQTNVWQVDQNFVYVPFDVLQSDLEMNADDSQTIEGTDQKVHIPARCNQILISVKDGVDLASVKPKIREIVGNIAAEFGLPIFGPDQPDGIRTETWDEKQGDILAAVEHEKILLVFLFGIVSIVAIFLIFCIFYMIVAEKTRDIGIIKSVGATSGGVAAIFLGYGLAIGIVGAGMGLLTGYLIIHNINEIHTWLGKHAGIVIWSPKTYLFPTIPNTMERSDVIVIVTIAILSSVLGAVVPAIRAARMNPVEALRFE